MGHVLSSVVLGAVGIVAEFVDLAVLTDYNFWLVAASAIILALATYLKGL